MRRSSIVLTIRFASATASADVTGRVIDLATSEGLPAAAIQIHGADGDQMVSTELDGTYKLTLAPGTYTLTISTPEYVDVVQTITVGADGTLKMTDISLAMVQAKAKEETIEVYDTIDTHKSSAVLAERRAAA